MQYVELKEALKDFTIFSLNDIKRIDRSFFRTRLNEWQGKGYIKKVIKGYYIFSDLELNENALFEIANKIYKPSYVSFETALSFYHLIPESVYGITSASTRRTYKFKTQMAEFSYRTIKPELFFGYELVSFQDTPSPFPLPYGERIKVRGKRKFLYYQDKRFKIASIEKTILDYFYINSHIKKENDFACLRMNKDIFLKQVNEEKVYHFLEKFAQKRLGKRIKSFLEFMQNA